MNKIWNMLLCGVAGTLLGWTASTSLVIAQVNRHDVEIDDVKSTVSTETSDRKFSDEQLEAHIGQLSDEQRALIENTTQLIALIKVQNQLNSR